LPRRAKRAYIPVPRKWKIKKFHDDSSSENEIRNYHYFWKKVVRKIKSEKRYLAIKIVSVVIKQIQNILSVWSFFLTMNENWIYLKSNSNVIRHKFKFKFLVKKQTTVVNFNFIFSNPLLNTILIPQIGFKFLQTVKKLKNGNFLNKKHTKIVRKKNLVN